MTSAHTSERNEYEENKDIRAFLIESERLMTEVQNLRDQLFYHKRAIAEKDAKIKELELDVENQKAQVKSYLSQSMNKHEPDDRQQGGEGE